MLKIVQKDSPVLRQKAESVVLADIKSATIQKLLSDMSQALAAQDDGVALAAPQIGVTKRIFIVSSKALGSKQNLETQNRLKDLVFINPKLLKTSKRKEEMEEGCLSVRWLYGITKRSTKASIEAYDESGKKFIRHGAGLMAQIFQHEIDHLEGILFTDQATNIKELKPEK